MTWACSGGCVLKAFLGQFEKTSEGGKAANMKRLSFVAGGFMFIMFVYFFCFEPHQ